MRCLYELEDVKMSTLMKAIYRPQWNPYQNVNIIFCRNSKNSFLSSYELSWDPNKTKLSLKILEDSQVLISNLLENFSNQSSVVLV